MACRCGAADPAAPCRPISQYVLKVHSRCDLSCDHCYVYQEADQTWRNRPARMAASTVRAAATRIAEHARAHALPVVHVVLHGGEPLLLGPAGLREVLAELRATLAPGTVLDLRMQTNGVLLDEELCRLLVAYDVKVGVSLDGDRAANDRHRLFAHGGSSHSQVRRALALLRRPEFRSSYAGILCTVDVRNDPDEVYSALLAEEPPRVDLLLPHATWDRPPWRPPGVATPYADWLGRIHQRWVDDGRPVPIRLFDALTPGRAGGGTEAVGLAPADLLVVETDGSWEQVDSLKVAFHGAPGTGLDVFAHPVDEAARHPGVAIRQVGLAGLCAECRACPVVSRCGGGLYPHRWRTGTGFDNPSVYCPDLLALIATVDSRPLPDRPVARRSSPGAPPGHAGDRPPGRPAAPAPRPAGSAGDRHVESATDRLLTGLAGGHGDPWALGVLAQTQLSITRALLATWRDTTGGSAAWELLTELDATAGEAVDAVLTHPFVRPWLVRRLARPGTPDDDLLPALAVVAGVRAEADAELEVPVRGDALVLPTLGRLTVAGARTATVRTVAGRLHVRAGSVERVVPLDAAAGSTLGWQPVRRVPVAGVALAIEDVDPERDCYGQPVAPTLDEPAAAALGRRLARAWQVVHRDVPAHGAALDAGLRAVVPLAPDPGAPLRSATAREAFGAVALTELPDAATMAVLLVHEWQHGKLGALLDLYDLVDPASTVRIPVAWRPDPRPVEGVLQGAYAHLAVAEVWHARAAADRPDPRPARGHAVRYRDWTREAVDALLGSGELTDLGERFVRRMRHALEGLRADPG
ncbi:FxsB family radical SAM/SPASM domain protein [Micromonospora sp. 15K316]|uniref:FxsB family cyclophane-forming radical SAM/SPASM peptide maturase n=1 Tax=Micromonospora sp. 15K316 TaxID=2530376 RepID=UPI001051D3FA|nr:FxsB family cyclophane-forming radical SAM/SPASM peptide maturase [Micromonospora sp. 15K316]TDC34703.1 FxsB family radical SAM/SPASM domain protein [Micromonospora sp. 15K316]